MRDIKLSINPNRASQKWLRNNRTQEPRVLDLNEIPDDDERSEIEKLNEVFEIMEKVRKSPTFLIIALLSEDVYQDSEKFNAKFQEIKNKYKRLFKSLEKAVRISLEIEFPDLDKYDPRFKEMITSELKTMVLLLAGEMRNKNELKNKPAQMLPEVFLGHFSRHRKDLYRDIYRSKYKYVSEKGITTSAGNKYYLIEDLANEVFVSVDTLRKWDRKGWIETQRSHEINDDDIKRRFSRGFTRIMDEKTYQEAVKQCGVIKSIKRCTIEGYLSNKDTMRKLGIRTRMELKRLRDSGKIRFIYKYGKTIYSKEDIEKLVSLHT